jgi:hypothetical protein
MQDFQNTAYHDDDGQLKQGHEYHTLYNMYNAHELGIILRWHNGKLHDDGELPAVEFQDTHIEHYRNGLLHNDTADEDGKLKPAIISGYAAQFEYYIDGKQIIQ